MKIYKKELKLADQIKNNNKVSCEATLVLNDQETEVIATKEKIKDNLLNQITLICADIDTTPPLFDYWKSCLECNDTYPISSILVSSIINKNGDCFSGGELIKAFKTCSFKPINWEHKGSEFSENHNIGVMVHPSLKKGTDPHNLFSLEEEEYSFFSNDVSGQVHIRQDGIIWGFYFPSYVEKVEQSLNLFDNLCVSMECFFNDFGYALTDTEGNVKLLNRSERNAEYSWHLKCYGGSGEIVEDGQVYIISRWLKDITFSGQGLTYNPANTLGLKKLSVILKDNLTIKADDNLVKINDSVYNNLTQIIASSDLNSEIKQMAETIEVTKANDQKEQDLNTLLAQKGLEIVGLTSVNAELLVQIDTLSKDLTQIKADFIKLQHDSGVEISSMRAELARIETIKLGEARLAELLSVNSGVSFKADQLALLDNVAYQMCLDACKLSQIQNKIETIATSKVEAAIEVIENVKNEEPVLVIASENNSDVLVAKELLTKLRDSKKANLNK